jgi:hypothetical protein
MVIGFLPLPTLDAGLPSVNDREAQRSIRQRTRGHIEQLEAQVSALQSQIAKNSRLLIGGSS